MPPLDIRTIDTSGRDPLGALETLLALSPGDMDPIKRRDFVRLLGASLALAGVTAAGCRRWPVEEIRPHTARPVGMIPGMAQFYASCFEHGGAASGILVRTVDGRPIKVEGHPDHSASLGAASHWAQASILELYDPERSRMVTRARAVEGTGHGNDLAGGRQPISWDEFDRRADALFARHRQRRGEGLGILAQPTSSPTIHRLRDQLAEQMPRMQWWEYEPLHRDSEFAGSQLAFRRIVRPQYHLDRARVIVCLDADLIGNHPHGLRHARDWALPRRDAQTFSRLYSIESCWSITGSAADERYPARPSQVAACADWLWGRLARGVAPEVDLSAALVTTLQRIAQDLERARGASLVAAGPAAPAAVHQCLHAVNHLLGNVGSTLSYTEEPLAFSASSHRALAALRGWLASAPETLIILGGNPVFDAGLAAEALAERHGDRAFTSIHWGLFANETSHACTWHLPAAHYLESWGDGRAWDGLYSVQQPMILPLYGGRSAIDLLNQMLGRTTTSAAAVRATFDAHFGEPGEREWERTLHDGFRPDSEYSVVQVGTPRYEGAPSRTNPGLEWRWVADHKVDDGRFANNGWLQELPDPITKLTWDNAALISPTDGRQWGVKTGDVIRIEDPSGIGVEIPAMVLPGQPAGCIALAVGYGRRRGGYLGQGVGVDVYPLARGGEGWTGTCHRAVRLGRTHQLAMTQMQFAPGTVADVALAYRLGRQGKPGALIHEALLVDYLSDHHAVHGDAHPVPPAPLFDPPHPFDTPHRWGMTIDLNACIGCQACVVACQAENNIPIVGKANVLKNREMHWLRIDRYFKGGEIAPDIVHVPTACVHCESAPCEQVCPVAATVHDSEGLNAMVYNRCIGTRYCGNNCPYKVRRFNFLDYHANDPKTPAKPWLGMPDQQQAQEVSPLVRMLMNPEVTVRMRGVMEKCTYCVQRLAAARSTARNEFARGQRAAPLVADGEVQTACQATCPTQAIAFGDLNEAHAVVTQRRGDDRNYEMLAQQNLGARTTYLAKLRNREAPHGDDHHHR